MSRFGEQLGWIHAQAERMARLVTAWANVNSGSYHLAGLDACAAAVAEVFGRLGGELRHVDLPPHRRVDDAGRETANPLGRLIRISKRPDAAVQVLLGIHYDTVYAADDAFQTVTRVDANTLNGPGVADAKGGLVVMLTALEALERSPFAAGIGWEVFINPDEEIGSPGSAPLLAQMARGKSAGLLFEPALPDGSLVSSRKGSGNFTAVVTGRSRARRARPAPGRNAIHALAEFVTAVAAMNDPPAGVTTNVGRVAGGGPVNVVPDLASCGFNVRVVSPPQQLEVEQRLKSLAEEFSSREGYTFRLHGGFASPPKPLDEPTLRLLEQVADCGREIGLTLAWKPSGGASDGNRLAAAGLPTVDTLGPVGGEIHSRGEFVRLDSLTERAKLAALVLMRMATERAARRAGTARLPPCTRQSPLFTVPR